MTQDLSIKSKRQNITQNSNLFWNKTTVNKSIVDLKSGFSCALKYAVSYGLPHLRPFNIGLNGELDLSNIIYIPIDYKGNRKDYKLLPGDVLFNNTNSVELVGKSAIVHEEYEYGFSNHITRIRIRDQEKLDPSWLLLCLRVLWLRGFFAENCNKWIGQAGFNATKLTQVSIPTPPIEIQHHIVSHIKSLLGELKGDHQLLDKMRRDTSRVMEAALTELINEIDKKYPDSPTLGELLSRKYIKILGGGTPSTENEEYWRGSIHWTSPRDMKRWYIDTTYKYISQTALQENKLNLVPEGSVLIVVRGMILAHTLPVGVTKNEVTINQDMKALVPEKNILAEYLGYILRARAPLILQQVETAAHGTRRLKTDTLKNVVIPILSISEQRTIIEHLNFFRAKVYEMGKTMQQDAQLLERLEQSILEKAFQGQL
ncbi:restriction endonuclease subunit S [Coleofasciculus chthonoplastes]|uniref:restriction endonuclease subunit S n=1 Tax=Coleofasciculus chthonoplastes TaxID=64178 RepID=UPI0032FA7505